MSPVTTARALSLAAGFLLAPALGGAAIAADPPAPPAEVPAAAGPKPVIDFSLGARYQTDYNFRGVSQSDRRGSVQTFFEAQYFDNLLYTGMATYQTRLPTRPDMEFDLIAGIRPKFDKFTFDLAIYYYNYPNERRAFLVDTTGTPFYATTANSDFYEGGGKVSYAYNDNLVLGAALFHSPNFFGTHAISTYAAGNVAYTLSPDMFPTLPASLVGGLTISGEVGHFALTSAKNSTTGFNADIGRFNSFNLPSYWYGNVGVSYAYKNLLLDLRYHTAGLDKRECFALTGDLQGFSNGGTSRWCGNAVIGSITWQLSTATPGIYSEPAGILGFFR
ncbi:conserved hypothetical protein [Methylobacterium sp. ap11]|uniref:TorF family putative porin n=1 Tax=Methylobacterium sp. ap11 TaxID=1761799 RepID=UPI0008C1EA63|nr:TorF family putative porin [Methylobacterium sp. ap11]SEP24122.1 conserved hypothetical protein [Methylobacterium sp. ap11]